MSTDGYQIEEVSEEELTALIKSTNSEKAKIVRKYDLKNLKGKKKKFWSINFNLTVSLDVGIVAGVS